MAKDKNTNASADRKLQATSRRLDNALLQNARDREELLKKIEELATAQNNTHELAASAIQLDASNTIRLDSAMRAFSGMTAEMKQRLNRVASDRSHDADQLVNIVDRLAASEVKLDVLSDYGSRDAESIRMLIDRTNATRSSLCALSQGLDAAGKAVTRLEVKLDALANDMNRDAGSLRMVVDSVHRLDLVTRVQSQGLDAAGKTIHRLEILHEHPVDKCKRLWKQFKDFWNRPNYAGG